MREEENGTPAFKRVTVDRDRFKVVRNNRGSYRGTLIQEFLDHLNPGRQAAGYRPYSAAALSMKLSDAGLKDETAIEVFLKECKAARNFSRFFHWSLKPRNQRGNL